MRRVSGHFVALLCGLIVAWDQVGAPTAYAATSTWNGTTDANWSTPGNWTPSGVPASDINNTDLIFKGTSNIDPNNADVSLSIHSIVFDPAAGAFVISGSAQMTGAGGITNNSAATETINADISVGGAPQVWTANTGDLSFGGTITLILSLTVDGAKNTEFSGTLAGTAALIKDGTGTLTMSGSGGTSVGVTLDAGTLKSGAPGGLPGNVGYTINGGTLDLNGNALTVSSLNGSAGTVNLNSANLTVNASTASGFGGVVFGDGGLIKSGTGTFNLTGANTYTGGTTVNGGTLQGTAGVGLQGDITTAAGTTVSFSQPDDSTYAGVISGAGRVTKNGFGTVILTGANTYSGGTTVSQGVLQGDTTSLQGDIGLTGATAMVKFSQTTTGTYTGVIDGTSGGVIKSNTGTVIFTGTNTYTVATTISDGTLQLGNGGATGSLDSGTAITDNATLAFNHNILTNFDNNISGTGGLHQLGVGTLLLGGTNTFTGASTVDALTTLQVGSGGTSGTIGSGAITDNGTLIFDRSDTVTANNNISGSGTVQQLGTGTLILGGNNSYTNGTSVTHGILQGTSNSLQGNIGTAGGTAVIFDQSFNGSTNAAISGGASLTKNGTGTVELSGVSTYIGATSINAGTLNVNGSIGSIASNVTVDTAGTLGGTGTVTGNVDNIGTLSAGSTANPVGTLTVNGDYHQESGSTFNVVIESNTSNKLNVTGTATLDAPSTFNVETPSSANAGTKATILQANTIVHSNPADYTVIDTLPGMLQATLSFSADDTMAFITILRNGETYEAVGNTFNERAVGHYLDQISATASGDLQTVFNQLNSIDDPALRIAESQMAGALHGTLGQIGVQNTTLIVAQVAQRLRSSAITPTADPCCCNSGGCHPDICSGCLEHSLFAPVPPCGGSNWTGWAQGFGLGGNAKSDGNAEGANYNMGGVLAGVERWLDDTRVIGFYGGYVGSTIATSAPNSFINGGHFGGYLYGDDGFNYWTIMNGYEFDTYTTHRLLQFGDIDREASANYNGWQTYVYAERGVSYESCGHLFQPFVGLQYLYLRQNSFTERGADSIDLAANGVNTNSLRSLLGARLQWAWMHRTCRRSFPEIHAYWLHEYLDSHTLVNATFSPTPEGGSTPFIAHGLDMGRDWAVAGASFTWEMHDCWSMFVNGDIQTNNQATLYIGSGGVGHVW